MYEKYRAILQKVRLWKDGLNAGMYTLGKTFIASVCVTVDSAHGLHLNR